ncbi:MAG: DotG/IcmE/VirB10 family protein [Rhodanobacter sp.]
MAKSTEGRTRTVMVAAIGVLVLGVVIGVWSFHRSADDADAPPSKVATAQAPGSAGQSITTPATKVYDGLLEQSNAQAAQDALKNGNSAMPVIRDQSQAGTSTAMTPVAVSTTPVTPGYTPAAQPTVDPRYQQDLADREKAIRERRAAMASQLTLLQKAWDVDGHVSEATHQGSADTSPTTPSPPATAKAAVSTEPPLVRTGDTQVAVLDTPINTDSPLPMYKAHIVSDGPLNGATVMGTLQTKTNEQYGSGVSLTFTKASLPTLNSAIDIQAIAVDASTGGAMSGQINNHTIQRYSAAFGGAFLQGVGQGLIQGGREQQVISSTTGYAVQSNAYTNKQLLELGAANVGTTAATTMNKDITRPPTITVAAGTTIGLMFMSDVPANALATTSTK